MLSFDVSSFYRERALLSSPQLSWYPREMAGTFLFYFLLLLGPVALPCLAQGAKPGNSSQSVLPAGEIQGIEKALREGRFREAQSKAQVRLTSQPDDGLAW